MDPFDEQLAGRIDEYIERLFVKEDPLLSQNLKDAEDAGLPPINVSPNQGKLLYLLAKMARTRRILEIGTLAGYSTLWLARALPREGTLITLEVDPGHAKVALHNLERAGLADLVEVRLGDARVSLQAIIDSGQEPFDLVFIDADKPSYPQYLHLVMQLARSGTIIMADNVIRNGSVLEDNPADPNALGARAYNLAIASHPRLESVILPIFRDKLDGVSLSVVK